MGLLQRLLNAGILPNDAQVLDQYYAAETDFLDGLEQTARALAGNQAQLVPPASEPWKSIHLEMLNGKSPAQGFNDGIATLAPDVQMALTGAVTQRMQDILQWLQQQQNNSKKRKTAEYVQALSNLGYKFRWNECTHEVECNGERMTDLKAAEIRGKMRDLGIWESNVVEDAYLAEAGKNRYHPMREYLLNLKFEGGTPITDLASHFVDERDVFATWLRRWLIGACARVMAGEQNRMLVMDGKQGLGKDFFARWLCPLDEYFYEGPILPDEKDHRVKLMSTWVWNVNELGSTTRRSDREALKAFLTTDQVKERKAFGRFESQGRAITSFIGTINNEGGILNDPTGHRRFMVTKLLSIDWAYASGKIERDQVWAEAMTAYLAGETWRLAGDELTAANEINEGYQTIDLVEETIKKLFVIEPGNANLWMTSLEIMEVLRDPSQGNLKPGTEIDTRRMASALTKCGLDRSSVKRTGVRTVRGYYGIRRGP